MAIPHAKPGEVVDVHPLSSKLTETKTHTLIKTDQVEVIRLVVPAGKEIAEHSAPGPMVFQCLEGKIEVTCGGHAVALEAGQLIHLGGNEPHAVRGMEDGSALLTLVLPRSESAG